MSLKWNRVQIRDFFLKKNSISCLKKRKIISFCVTSFFLNQKNEILNILLKKKIFNLLFLSSELQFGHSGLWYLFCY